jgi:hypothetical protein
MKYLSSKPFTGGVNSRAFVDRWEDTFGKPQPCDDDGEVSAMKDFVPADGIDRQITMSRLGQWLRQAHGKHLPHEMPLPLSLSREEIFSLLLLLEEIKERGET